MSEVGFDLLSAETAQPQERLQIELDAGPPVDDKDYQVPFPFTGMIDKLTVKLGPKEM